LPERHFRRRSSGPNHRANARQPITVNTKTGVSSLVSQVVTEVDHLSQAIILQTLAPTCSRYDLALLTEESPDDRERLVKDYFWCIDPLDGTLPFIESTPGYAVSIALVSKQGIPLIGIIYDPLTATLYHAIKGQDAFKNDQPLQLKLALAFTFLANRSFKSHNAYPTLIDRLKSFSQAMGLSGFNTIEHGGAAMNACWVLEHAPACYIKFPKPQAGGGSLWNYAATACLFNESSAIACDIHGQPLDLNRPDSTFMNYKGVLYAQRREHCRVHYEVI
jgi:myo-inositol-1(or 4)-monophosphatase